VEDDRAVTELTGIEPGAQMSSYRVDLLVGRGGMGEVYRAWDERLERNVALKILPQQLAEDDAFRERLLRESRVAASLDHANVVPVYEAGEADGRFFLAMRYVDGTDLRTVLHRDGALPPERVLEIATQIASALDAAHAQGLVHRDVKPSNVLVDERGHCYLADFGLTQSVSSRGQPTDGSLLGTLDYVAPEQIRGDDVDGRADVYSLGCLLFECMTGEVPFARPSEVATIYAHLEEGAPLASHVRPDLPRELDAVLTRAMAKDPEERQATCGELVLEVAGALGLKPGSGHTARRRGVAAIVGLAAIAVAAVVATLALTTDSATPAAAPPGTLARIDAATNEVIAREPVQGRPGNLVVAGGDVWMADFFEGVLWRYSPSSRALQKVTSNGEPRDLAAVGNQLYVAADAGFFAGNVSRYDATTGIRRDGIGDLACAIASGEGVVWMAGCPAVQRLSTDAKPLRKLREIYPGFNEPMTADNNRAQFRELAIGAGSLWVLGDALDRRVWRLDARSGDELAEISLDFPPRSAVVGGGVLWVTDSLGDTLGRIDIATNRLLEPLEVGRLPGGVAVGGGSVWVPNALDGTVMRLDLRTGERQETIDVGGFPREVAFADGSVWVTGYEG
jgi:sugar lactone lactonase YvrE/predicted Ser/Thr protein kinase